MLTTSVLSVLNEILLNTFYLYPNILHIKNLWKILDLVLRSFEVDSWSNIVYIFTMLNQLILLWYCKKIDADKLWESEGEV